MEIGHLLQRPPTVCYRKYHMDIVKTNRFQSTVKWTQEEDDRLRDAVEEYGDQNWTRIAHEVDGKTNTQCYHRYSKVSSPDIKRGKWSKEEDFRLKFAVEIYSTHDWNRICPLVPGRTDI